VRQAGRKQKSLRIEAVTEAKERREDLWNSLCLV